MHAKALLSNAAPSGLVASNVRTSTSEAHSTTKPNLVPNLLQNLVPNLQQKPPTSQNEAAAAKEGKVAGNASDLEAGDGDESDLEAGAGDESDLEARELAAAAPRVAQAADEQEKRLFTTNLPSNLLSNRAVSASDLEAAPAAAQLLEHAAATRPAASCVHAAAAAPRDLQPDEQAEISRKLGSKSVVKSEQQQTSASERERERDSARVAAVEQAVRGESAQTDAAADGSSETPQLETKKKKRKRHKDRHGSAGLSHGVAAESG